MFCRAFKMRLRPKLSACSWPDVRFTSFCCAHLLTRQVRRQPEARVWTNVRVTDKPLALIGNASAHKATNKELDWLGPRHFRKGSLKEAAGACGGRWLWEMNASLQLRESGIKVVAQVGAGQRSVKDIGWRPEIESKRGRESGEKGFRGCVDTRARRRAVSTSALRCWPRDQEVSKKVHRESCTAVSL